MLSELLLSTLVLTASTGLLVNAAPQAGSRCTKSVAPPPRPTSPASQSTSYPPPPPPQTPPSPPSYGSPVLVAAAAGGSGGSGPAGGRCDPVSGTFNITNFRYYPENADWDTKRCLLYGSANPNGTLLIYDPYTQEQTVIRFPGISDDAPAPVHVSGIDYDARTDRVFISAGAAQTWVSLGQNVTGPDTILKFNPETREVEWRADFNEFTAQIERDTGIRTGGFQDQAEDSEGNSYCVGAFGNVIAKLDGQTGSISPFYITPKEEMNATSYGMLGIVSITNGTKLVLSDAVGKRFVTFDLPGPSTGRQPTDVKLSRVPPGYDIFCDGLYAPPKYNDQVLLCSDTRFGGQGDAGAIVVYGSKDGWVTGEHLGAIRNNDEAVAVGSAPCSTVQMAESIFISEEYFFDYDPTAPEGYGNRTEFPMVDITTKVDELARVFLQ